MGTKVHFHIETDDMDIAERIGRALNNAVCVGMDLRDVGDTPAPKPAEETPDPEANEKVLAEPVPEKDLTNEGQHTYPNGQDVRDDLDADGLPWDERIHASTKTRTADDRWKKKRGVADDVKKKVEAELKEAMALPSPAPAPAPESGGYADPAATFGGEPAPAPAPAPEQEQTPPPPADTAAPTTFMELVGEIGKRQATQADINAALQACEPPIPSFQTLGQRPDLIPAF